VGLCIVDCAVYVRSFLLFGARPFARRFRALCHELVKPVIPLRSMSGIESIQGGLVPRGSARIGAGESEEVTLDSPVGEAFGRSDRVSDHAGWAMNEYFGRIGAHLLHEAAEVPRSIRAD